MNSMKKKKIIFSVITLIAFLVLFLGNFYTREAYASNIYFTNFYAISDQLHTGDVIEQEFTLREGDQGISLLLGTYVTTITSGTVEAELYDMDGNLVSTTEASLVGINDNEKIPIYFGDIDERYYGQKLNIRMTFLDIDDQLLATFISTTDTEKYQTLVNGEERAWNMTMDGIQETVYLEFYDFRRFYVFFIGVFALYMGMFKIKWNEINPRDIAEKCKDTLLVNWKNILIAFGLIAGSALIGTLAEMVLSKGDDYANPYRGFAIAAAVFLVGFAVTFYKYLWKRAHIFFFVVVMLVGSVYITSQPPTPIGYDEPIHYTRTTYLSWGGKDRISISDYLMMSMYTQKEYYDIFSQADRQAWVEEANAIDGLGEIYGYFEIVGIASVPYMLTSIVLYVLRLLHVDFITRYLLGKLTNLFLYSVFFATAMKCLKGRGKILVAMVGLIPTNIFMASNYGCDWWIISLVVLGYAIFIGELQQHDKISTKKFLLATGVMVVAALPKAVYFPLLLPMMLLKKERYEESKKCRWVTVAGMVFLVLSFVLPLFISVDAGAVAGGGDIRGGTDVNAAGQIMYILGDIWGYICFMTQFIIDYLHPDRAIEYLTATAYQGYGTYYTLVIMILTIATFIDNDTRPAFRKREPLAIAGGYISALGTVILAATALYVSYTPVGADYIQGCQARYLIPTLFPFLYFAGEMKLDASEEVKHKVFAWGSVVMGLVTLLTIYDCYIIRY